MRQSMQRIMINIAGFLFLFLMVGSCILVGINRDDEVYPVAQKHHYDTNIKGTVFDTGRP